MEVHYKREMKHNYLIVEPDEGNKPGYEARMLLNNAVEGLLRFHIKYMDERQSYYYDITSMQPLGRILQNRFIDRGEICQLLIQLHVALRRMEEYLLSEDGLLLDPDYIYVEPEGFRTGLCLVPGMAGNFPDRLSRLLQYLMKKVDHRDKESVVLAYELYQESLKENFSVEDLMKLVQREGRTMEASAPATLATDFDPHWEQGGGIDAPGRQRQSWDEGGDRAAGGAGPGERERRFESGENAGEPGVKWAEAREGEAQKTGTSVPLLLRLVLKQLVVISLIAAGAPAFLWFIKGPSAVGRFRLLWLVLPAAALVLSAVGDIVYVVFGKRTAGEAPREMNGEALSGRWEIPEEEPEPEEEAGRQEPEAEEEFQTTLLAGRAESGLVRRLEPREEKMEDILIPYFPFIIGKHEELVDYVLNRSTVSRLHVRIDREGEEYRITDLNSTNGTMVGGRLLEANETAGICTGDEICIADLYFTFR